MVTFPERRFPDSPFPWIRRFTEIRFPDGHSLSRKDVSRMVIFPDGTFPGKTVREWQCLASLPCWTTWRRLGSPAPCGGSQPSRSTNSKSEPTTTLRAGTGVTAGAWRSCGRSTPPVPCRRHCSCAPLQAACNCATKN